VVGGGGGGGGGGGKATTCDALDVRHMINMVVVAVVVIVVVVVVVRVVVTVIKIDANITHLFLLLPLVGVCECSTHASYHVLYGALAGGPMEDDYYYDKCPGKEAHYLEQY